MKDPPLPKQELAPKRTRALRGFLKGKAMLEALAAERRLDREREEVKIVQRPAAK